MPLSSINYKFSCAIHSGSLPPCPLGQVNAARSLVVLFWVYFSGYILQRRSITKARTSSLEASAGTARGRHRPSGGGAQLAGAPLCTSRLLKLSGRPRAEPGVLRSSADATMMQTTLMTLIWAASPTRMRHGRTVLMSPPAYPATPPPCSECILHHARRGA